MTWRNSKHQSRETRDQIPTPNGLISKTGFEISALFEKYVNDRFSEAIRKVAEPQPAARISPWTPRLPEIPPAPLY